MRPFGLFFLCGCFVAGVETLDDVVGNVEVGGEVGAGSLDEDYIKAF